MVSHKLFLFLALFVVVTSCRHQSENVNPAAAWRVRTIKTQFDKTTCDYINGQLSQTNKENFLRDTLGHIPQYVCANWSIENGELVTRSCSTNQTYGFATQLGANGKVSTYLAAYDFRDRKSTRLNSSHLARSRMPSSA